MLSAIFGHNDAPTNDSNRPFEFVGLLPKRHLCVGTLMRSKIEEIFVYNMSKGNTFVFVLLAVAFVMNQFYSLFSLSFYSLFSSIVCFFLFFVLSYSLIVHNLTSTPL